MKQGPNICSNSLIYKIYNHYRSPTSMHLWSSISATSCKGNLLLKKRSSTLRNYGIKSTKPSRIVLVNDFRTEGHLTACHLVAYGRTATACQHLIWLQSQNHPVHTISASVPKFSATPTTLHNLTHSPWNFPAVTLIRCLCIRDLCRPAKQSISTSLEAILHP